MLDRLLVAFEAPSELTDESYEEAWDRWSGSLVKLGLELVADLDPVFVTGDIHVYEVVAR